MPHKVLNFLLDHQASPHFYEDVVPSFIGASIQGLDGEGANGLWDWIDQKEPSKFPANKPFIWRTGADSLGHIPPHHMVMILLTSSLMMLQNSPSPDRDIEDLFNQFAEASFGEKDRFEGYWSRVRKFRIGNSTPLAST